MPHCCPCLEPVAVCDWVGIRHTVPYQIRAEAVLASGRVALYPHSKISLWDWLAR
jgi:hypothetical protein